jgi:hypothetical protein
LFSGGVWGGAQFAMDFVLVGVGQELVKQAVGPCEFADLIGCQEWREAFLPVVMAALDFAFGLGRWGIEEFEIVAEVLAPTMLCPLDAAPIIESVSRTGRLLVVEEGQGFGGFGAEVITVCAEALSDRPLIAARVCARAHPIPCSRELEKQALPDPAAICNEIQKLMNR